MANTEIDRWDAQHANAVNINAQERDDLLNWIRLRETCVFVQGYGTVNVALSLSADTQNVYKLQKKYLRRSLESKGSRDSEEIKADLLTLIESSSHEDQVDIFKQQRARVLSWNKRRDVQSYFIANMRALAESQRLIIDYKNIDNFGSIDGNIKVIDSDLTIRLTDNDSEDLNLFCDAVINDFIGFLLTTEKPQDAISEIDLIYLVIALSAIGQLSEEKYKSIQSRISSHPYASAEQIDVFNFMLDFYRSDWQKQCMDLGCFSLKTSLDLFAVKLSFAKTYFSQSNDQKKRFNYHNPGLVKDIQRESNPTLLMNRLSHFLYRPTSWLQLFLQAFSLFKPILFKHQCLSVMSFFCSDTLKQSFSDQKQEYCERTSSLSQSYGGLFSWRSSQPQSAHSNNVSDNTSICAR